MIIDGEDGSPKRQPEPPTSPAQLHASAPFPSSSQPLLAPTPDAPPPPNYLTAVSTPYAHQQQLSEEQQTRLAKLFIRESVERRFLRAFILAVTIWILLASLFKTIADVAHARYYIGVPTNPRASDGTVLECYGSGRKGVSLGWASSSTPLPSDRSSLPKYISQLQLELPVNASAHYLLAAGSLAYGQVTLVREEREDISTISVAIEARYYVKSSFEETKVCLLARDGDARGIGIYTPTYAFGQFPADKQLELRISYAIPISRRWSERPTALRVFQSDMPNFSHAVEPMQATVLFDRLELEGSNGKILVQSLSASYVALKTSNADIGISSVMSNSTVYAQTSNGNVEILDAQMTNTDTFHPSTIVALTSNGHIGITAQMLWVPRWRSSVAGSFAIGAETSNGRLDIAVRHAPATAKLSLTGSTTNAPALALLYPTFEGQVLLRTSPSAPPPIVTLPDPGRLGYVHPVYGASRTYVAVPERPGSGTGRGDAGEWRGQLAWGTYETTPTPPWWGTVSLKTTNNLCSLRVPCVSSPCLYGSPVVLNQSDPG